MITLRKNIKNDLDLSINICKYNFRRKSSSSHDDYQYWQKSIVPTFHFQKSLPRLPIPKLENTCERYLKAVRPLLNDYRYGATEKDVLEFRDGPGVALQKELIDQDKRNKHTSYISQLWFDMYLSDRKPLPLNYNPCLVYVNRGDEFYDQQLIKTANLVISSLRFYKSLKDEILEPEVFHMNPKNSDTKTFRLVTKLLPSSLSWYGAYFFKAFPLDMVQYSSLFNSSRIPQIGKDRLFRTENQKHIVVIRKGHFYTVEVLDERGNILSPEVILASIRSIIDDTSNVCEHPVGVLTTTNRDKWAEARKHLEQIGNSEALHKIDSSLFVVALDNVLINSTRDTVRWFLHSDGHNRWFDKSFTLISTTNGYAGINFEHSWGDGVAILRYFQDIFKDFCQKPWIDRDTPTVSLDDNRKPKKLDFNVDDTIKKDIERAKIEYQTTCNSLDVHDLITDIGRDMCKELKVSPDAVMQLAFQLAYYNLTQSTIGTYESCSTAAYKHGRTETVRPCTIETKNFCEAIRGGLKDICELQEMIAKCSTVHTELVKNAAMGQGFDRHLFVLHKLAETKAPKSIPNIFNDVGYKTLNYNVLSTSTLLSDLVQSGGFGPVVSDGYGIAYMIRKDSCGAVITNYKDHTNGPEFVECLLKSFDMIRAVLLNKKESLIKLTK